MVLVEILKAVKEVNCIIKILVRSEGNWAGRFIITLFFVVSDLQFFDLGIEDVDDNTEDDEYNTNDEE